jgi:quercetin dioxygenase-like cupin family protein
VEISGEPHHRPTFENEVVRVWQTVLPAGEATLWHRHNFDNVAVTISEAKLRVEPLAGPAVESETKMGDVAFRSASYVHRAISVGGTTYHNFLIELLKPLGGIKNLKTESHPPCFCWVLFSTPAENDSERKPVFENERVRAYRVSLAPGESLAKHTHSYAGLALVLTAAEIAITTEGSKEIQRLQVSVGDARWRPGPVTHSIKNIGKTRFEAVDIEVK